MMEGPCADSEEKREPAGDIDTVVVDGLKVLDPKRPIREADIQSFHEFSARFRGAVEYLAFYSYAYAEPPSFSSTAD
jgi:hypothetical protein